MVGVPFQSIDDMVGDLQFFKEFGADMIGLGPYVVQAETPLGM
jgi:biotin synthase